MANPKATKRSFSHSGSSPLTPARRIYDELEAGDSLAQSPAAKRAKRSGRRNKPAVLDENSSEKAEEPTLDSLADAYNMRLAEIAGTVRKNRLAKGKTPNPNEKQNPSSGPGPKNEPNMFNPVAIKTDHQDTPTKSKKNASPSKKKGGNIEVEANKEAQLSTAALELTQTDKMDIDQKMDALNVAAATDGVDDNRFLSPPLNSDHEPAIPAGTKTLKAINKRLKSLDAKLSTTTGAPVKKAHDSSASDETKAIQHLQEDVMLLLQRMFRDEIRAQVRHQIMFNSIKSLAVAIHGLAGQEKDQESGSGVATSGMRMTTSQTQTLEFCLDKYMDDLSRASTTEEVSKIGKLCVKYAGDLFKTL
ncbi:hypothetical protein QBC38DRAFT_120290 [Podospora fimiseda]|uniref:Uncharacterized protein n=1 Tax=Podospora fimiseda TaxID=252190 RepID=A0AAN7H2S5_9PEZI|nr:hypothetical protein QBC38DRAFT_120290 [Podospora fimiseda]